MEAATSEVLIVADIARFLCSLVEHSSERLSDKHWDFILCSLASWIQVRKFCNEVGKQLLPYAP